MSLNTDTPLYIAGSWRTASGPDIDVYDPRDESVLATVASATPSDVRAALEAARTAQRNWARRPAAERGAYLRAAADLVHRERDRLARLVSEEVGKPLAQAHGEVDFAEGFLRYNAEWDRRRRRNPARRLAGRDDPFAARAARRRRRDLPVELSARSALSQARAGPGHRQHHRDQAE
jgi:acyl-CoA reductase-like NAD-dependent aldehyde dehydrogenase